MSTPPLLAPTVEVAGDLFDPTSCRLSPDGSLLAFWVADSNPRTLFVAPTDQPSRVGDLAQPAWSTTDAHLADLAWSPARGHLAFTLTSGPPPGDVTIGVLRLADRKVTTLPGLASAWLAPTLLIVADPATNRLYARDVTTGHDQTVAELADDGDPHFPPVLSVSPDGRRFMLVTRRIQDGWTRVQTGVRDDAGVWALRHLTDLPGVSIRVEPFWSADGGSAALYIVDLERNHSAIVAVPDGEGEGQILYQSETVDAAVRPAAHPGTPLIAFVRAHPRDGSAVLTENRLVMLDPVNHAVTPLATDPAIVGKLRFIDDRTLIVEGRAVWTIKLRAKVEETGESTRQGGSAAAAPVAQAVPTSRVTVQAPQPAWTFSVEIPDGWQRVPLPPDEPDFDDMRVMRPLVVYMAPYAPILFTVAVRPCPPGAVMPGAAPSAMLNFLADAQGMKVENPGEVKLPAGLAAHATARQNSDAGPMVFRLYLLEHAGNLFSLTTMTPEPLWAATRETLDRIVASFRPRTGATPFA